jgi:hypothetical protein
MREPIRPKEHLLLIKLAGASRDLVELQLKVWRTQAGFAISLNDLKDVEERAAVLEVAKAIIAEEEATTTEASTETEELKATVAEALPEDSERGEETIALPSARVSQLDETEPGIPRQQLTPPGVGGGGET